MKRLILIILAVLATATTYAQRRHLDFEFVELKGDAINIADTLATIIGGEYVSGDKNGELVEGKYKGCDCQILVSKTPLSKICYGLVVTADFTEKAYTEIFGSCLAKYGSPDKELSAGGTNVWFVERGFVKLTHEELILIDHEGNELLNAEEIYLGLKERSNE